MGLQVCVNAGRKEESRRYCQLFVVVILVRLSNFYLIGVTIERIFMSHINLRVVELFLGFLVNV